jgi:hypothetical protein
MANNQGTHYIGVRPGVNPPVLFHSTKKPTIATHSKKFLYVQGPYGKEKAMQVGRYIFGRVQVDLNLAKTPDIEVIRSYKTRGE